MFVCTSVCVCICIYTCIYNIYLNVLKKRAKMEKGHSKEITRSTGPVPRLSLQGQGIKQKTVHAK